MNASIYAYDRKFILNENMNTVFSDLSMISVMEEWSAVDIDTAKNFEFVEFLVCKKIVHL